MKRKLGLVLLLLLYAFIISAGFTSCDSTSPRKDIDLTLKVADILQKNQPTPTDIEYSTTRYLLTRKAYWLNGMYEKAASLPRPINMPLGYIIIYAGNEIASYSPVDGPRVSLQNYLTPISENYSSGETYNEWLADVDGTYGDNPEGWFWFSPSGHYRDTTNRSDYFDNFPEFELALSLSGLEYKEVNQDE